MEKFVFNHSLKIPNKNVYTKHRIAHVFVHEHFYMSTNEHGLTSKQTSSLQASLDKTDSKKKDRSPETIRRVSSLRKVSQI